MTKLSVVALGALSIFWRSSFVDGKYVASRTVNTWNTLKNPICYYLCRAPKQSISRFTGLRFRLNNEKMNPRENALFI